MISRILRKRVRLLATALPLVACASPEAAASPNAALVAKVDSLVRAYQRASYAPAVSVAVVRGAGDTLVYRGYGEADVEHHVPATPATIYPIGSVTKQFTAAAVLKLAEQGRLSLDDRIGGHLPRLPAEWRAIRIRQLLNHTAGLPQYPVLLPRDMAPDSVLALAAREPSEFEPGTSWSYSNVGYLVLGLLIEKVSGESYAGHLESKFLRPLGLASTRYCDAGPAASIHAAGYMRRDTGVVPAPRNSMRAIFAAGALCSTVGDLATWNHALATGRVVSPGSWARMTTPEAVAGDYGYGLIVQKIDGATTIGHGGRVVGFRSSTAYLPRDSLYVAVLTNLEPDSPTPLLLNILRAAREEKGSREGAASPAP